MSTLIRGWTLLQKAKTKVSMEQKQKFSSTFYKRWQIPKTASLVALRRVRNSRVELVQLSSSGAFLKDQKELCSVAIGNFAQSFMGKKANSRLKTCFQSTFLQEKKFSQTARFNRLPPKSSRWEVFGSTSFKLEQAEP